MATITSVAQSIPFPKEARRAHGSEGEITYTTMVALLKKIQCYVSAYEKPVFIVKVPKDGPVISMETLLLRQEINGPTWSPTVIGKTKEGNVRIQFICPRAQRENT